MVIAPRALKLAVGSMKKKGRRHKNKKSRKVDVKTRYVTAPSEVGLHVAAVRMRYLSLGQYILLRSNRTRMFFSLSSLFLGLEERQPCAARKELLPSASANVPDVERDLYDPF